jgi:hypothetical protein
VAPGGPIYRTPRSPNPVWPRDENQTTFTLTHMGLPKSERLLSQQAGFRHRSCTGKGRGGGRRCRLLKPHWGSPSPPSGFGAPPCATSHQRSASIDEVYQCPHRHHIGFMPHLELSDEEAAALLTRTIADDRYPLSPRIRTLRGILAKLRAEPVRERCRRRRLILRQEQQPPRRRPWSGHGRRLQRLP